MAVNQLVGGSNPSQGANFVINDLTSLIMKRLIAPPTLTTVLQQLKNDIFTTFNCHRVGIIQKFDSVTCTAQIQIVDKLTNATYNGITYVDFPILQDVPVFMPINIDKGFTYPIIEGQTECLICFNDRDISNWFENGQIQIPNSQRTHNLSDGLAIIGFRSLLNKIQNYNSNATEMRYEETIISLDDKVKIQNSIASLKNLMDSLFSILQNLKTVNGLIEYPIDATTASALTALQSQFNSLLK